MRKRILSALAALAAVALAGLGLAQVTSSASASSDFGAGTVKGALVKIDATSPRGEYVDANGIHHCLPQGPNAISKGAQSIGDYPAMWFALDDPACDFGAAAAAAKPAKVGAPAVSPISVVHKTVAIDATFEAGSVADRTVTLTAPAYRGTAYEVVGSNAADAAAGLNIAVTPVPPGLGSTARKFVVTTSGFAGTTKTFTLDLWVIGVTP